MKAFPRNFPPIPFPPVGSNAWTVRNLFYSHCEDYGRHVANSDHVHYVRSCSRRLFAYLDNQKAAFDAIPVVSLNSRLPYASIAGASGVGKSTEVFGWLQLQPENIRRYFLHNSLGEDPVSLTSFFENQGQHAKSLSSDLAFHIISEAHAGDIVVLDGSFSAKYINRILSLALELRIFIVLCVSGQSIFTHAAQLSNFTVGNDPNTGKKLSALYINGFTLDDYHAARNIIAHNFDDSHKKTRNSRFYYSGGSARIYYHIGDPQTYILQKISAANDFSNFFNAGDASKNTLNTLKTYTNGVPYIVSEFAAKMFSQKVDHSFIEAAQSKLPDNPAWQGWVAELDMLQRIRHCAYTNSTWIVSRVDNDPIWWQVNITAIIDYSSLEDLETRRISYDEIKANPNNAYVFIPEQWNNWGFDAVLVHFVTLSRDLLVPMIRFLQCTLAKKHTKKFSRLAAFMAAMFPLEQPAADNAGASIPIYSEQSQKRFLPAQIEYSIMTRKSKFTSHRSESGRISNIEAIKQWQPNFSIPDNVGLYYFDADCATDCKLDNYFK